jgi:hypothetical protein
MFFVIIWLMLNLVMFGAFGGVRVATMFWKRKLVHDTTAALLMVPVKADGRGLADSTTILEKISIAQIYLGH